MTRLPGIHLLALILVSALLLASCGGDDERNNTNATDADTAGDTGGGVPDISGFATHGRAG